HPGDDYAQNAAGNGGEDHGLQSVADHIICNQRLEHGNSPNFIVPLAT
ncbi:MAG: hypothetical protein QG591_171, partial [Planctomycetota bacterium]|nr:hypothetical protein [Planctomycetota bacterium]